MLKINQLTKIYDAKKKAVDNLTLHIEKGDIYGFIGANGAGKTTVIKSAVGIHQFDEGEIFIDGLNIKDHPLECKRIFSYIPDNPDIYEHLTGIGYINFIADIFELSTAIRTEKIEKYATLFEMTENLGNVISSYSHGMKQRIVIIAALIHSPKLLILDEPFVGLDPKATFNLKQIMQEITAGGGSIFFSTHVLDVAEKLCTKIAIIKKGELIASGEIQDIIGKHSLEDIFMEAFNDD